MSKPRTNCFLACLTQSGTKRTGEANRSDSVRVAEGRWPVHALAITDCLASCVIPSHSRKGEPNVNDARTGQGHECGMREVAYVQKDKQLSSGGRYRYVSDAAVIASLRPAMVSHGLILSPISMDVVANEEYESAN